MMCVAEDLTAEVVGWGGGGDEAEVENATAAGAGATGVAGVEDNDQMPKEAAGGLFTKIPIVYTVLLPFGTRKPPPQQCVHQ